MKLNFLYLTCLATLIGSITACGGDTAESGSPQSVPTSPTNVTLAAQSISTKEGKQGERKTVTVSLRLSKAHDQAIKLAYVVNEANDFATGRYEASSGTTEISAGVREKKLEFTILGNERHESDGLVSVDFTLDASATNVNLINNRATIIISDDDPVPSINLAVEKIDVREGVGSVDIKATLDRQTYQSVTARLTFDGLASSNDYHVEQPSIVFEADELTAKTTITIFDDDVIEGSETVDVAVQSAVNAELGNAIAMRIIIQGDLKLNDTGVVSYFNAGDFNSNAPDNAHLMQDADFGLDTDANYQLNGKAGFFYNKIDGAGNALPENDSEHECVFDAHTGLTWEIKGDYFYHEFALDPTRDEEAEELSYTAQHYNNRNGRYMWYQANDTINGGSRGGVNDKELSQPVMASQNCIFPHRDHPLYVNGVSQKGCTTDKYEELIQKSAMCGFIDWRLPTITELQTLVIYENAERGYDTKYFPDSFATDASHNGKDFVYLSSTPSVDNEASVWCLDASERRVKLCNKTDYHHVRLVRGNQF